MLEKFHEFEKMRRKRNFRLGLFIGITSVCAAAALVYVAKKTLEEKLHDPEEDTSYEVEETPAEESAEEA